MTLRPILSNSLPLSISFMGGAPKSPLPKGRSGLSAVFAWKPSYLIPIIQDLGRKLCDPTFRKTCPSANDSLNAMITSYFSIVTQVMCLELPEAPRILIRADDFSAKIGCAGMILAVCIGYYSATKARRPKDLPDGRRGI